MSDLKQIVKENFTRYAGNVILDRAICDVRDMLKPSARMLMYSQVHITKNIPSKPFIKSARVVGDCLGRYYTHGDASCYSTYMRMAKPFAMRYPLEDCQGNTGTINATGDEAAPRYTELRLSQLGYSLFDGIDKETIQDWCDNFDETEIYPKVLCSKGFYNIVNGSTGIGVSLSASIPQFNIRDINEAMINLINNPNYEVNILPDFATGGILLNSQEVSESLKKGYGAACKLRSVVEYDNKERAFIITELPYGVYADTISEQIQNLLEKNPDCGIDHINNGSGKTPDYIIYLTKRANPDKVLKLLYKETSLQSHYTINMTVLTDNGRTPRVLGLKEMLLDHIAHEKIVYRRGFEYDLAKIEKRIHIIDGLLICIASIDEVVKTIKSAPSTMAASKELQSKFLLDEEQAKAVLDMKLSRLANLEVKKLEDEREKLKREADNIHAILENEDLFNNELIRGWREVAQRFGDARRTRILNVEKDEDEVVEKKQLSLSFTNKGAVFVTETSSLYSQRRNGIGTKFKLEPEEFVVDNLVGENTDTILFFTKKGMYYHMNLGAFNIGEKQYLSNFNISGDITAAALVNKKDSDKNIVFITKNGLIKKSKLSEYNLKRSTGAQALKLDDGDEIVSILFIDNEQIGILSRDGQFIMIESTPIRALGRLARGIIGIKLSPSDYVVSARAISKDSRYLFSITSDGYGKNTALSEFNTTNTNTKGVKIQKSDNLCDFIPIAAQGDILVNSNTTQIRIKSTDIPTLSRGALGVKLMKLTDNYIIGISSL